MLTEASVYSIDLSHDDYESALYWLNIFTLIF